MIYIVGIAGFVGGFIFGQMVLYFLLRHKSRKELLADETLKWRCALVNWGLAALGAYSFVMMYQHQY